MQDLTPLIANVATTLRRRALCRPEDRVAVAISGGADSVALAFALRELQERGGPAIAGLIHVNHGLRAADSDADEAFCRALADRAGWPIEVRRVDAAAAARTRRSSIEVAARDARYAFFPIAAAELRADLVATAHTLDDQVETVLLRLLRGAGARGVAGIPPRRGIFIRPLIDTRRGEVRDWLASIGETWREDASNADLAIPRNRIRHELLPVIEQLAPEGAQAIARFASLAADDDAWLETQAIEMLPALVLSRVPALKDRPTPKALSTPKDRPAMEAMPALKDRPTPEAAPALKDRPTPEASPALKDRPTPKAVSALKDRPTPEALSTPKDRPAARLPVRIDAARLDQAPAALARRVVRRLVDQLAPHVTFGAAHVEAVRALARADTQDSAVDLPGIRATRAGDVLTLESPPAARAVPVPFRRTLDIPGSVSIPEAGVVITARAEPAADVGAADAAGFRAVLQRAAITPPLVVRSWRPGDRIRPLGAPGRRKLQDLFVDRKIPRIERHYVPVVEDAAGQILWVAGVALAETGRVPAPEAGVVILEMRKVQ